MGERLQREFQRQAQRRAASCPPLPSRPTLSSGWPSRAHTSARFSHRLWTTNRGQATSRFERAPIDGPSRGPRPGRLRERGWRVAGGRERETHSLEGLSGA
jgi:hypothetical protein